MAHGTQQELSRGISKAGGTAKRGATRLSSMAVRGAKNTARGGVKLAKNMAKEGVKGGLKATLGASKLATLFTTPLGWILLGVAGLLIVIVAVDAHHPSTSRNYKEDYIKFTSSTEEVKTITVSDTPVQSSNPKIERFIDEEMTEYDGDAYVGQASKQYKEYFEEAFDYVFHELCKKEVETVIKKYGYDYNRTMDSYLKCEDPFMNLNYAEIICVMSQNPLFSLYEGSLSEIMDWLEKEEHLEYLYYMNVIERLDSTEVWSGETTYSDSDYPYSDSPKVIGTILEEEKIPFMANTKGYSSLSSWFNEKFKSPTKAELKAYAKEAGNSEFKEINGFITNGRTVITPVMTDKPSWTFTTTLKEINLVKGFETVGWEYDTAMHKMMPVYKEKEEYEYVTETKLISTYKYGEVEIYPYSLSDLYKCFETEYSDTNTDHQGLTNIELLDYQEEFLRNYIGGEEELLGTNTARSPLFSAYTALLANNLSEYNLELQAIMSQIDLNDFQKNVYEIARSMENIPYGSSYGGFSPFVCCNYVWYVMHLCGIDICPKHMPEEGAKAINLNPNTDIRYKCTLQCYYYETYQPQAIVARTYNEGTLEVGDIIFTQYDVDYSATPRYNIPKSKWSDHVYIYLGDGYMAEQAGGKLNRVYYGKVSNGYKNATYMVVRPTLISN